MDWKEEWKERGIPEDQWPVEHPNPVAKVTRCHRLTADENRPGQCMFYCWVRDPDGFPVGGVKIRFETESSEAVAYDHPNVWGVTGTKKGREGYLEYDHPAIPTRYDIYVDDCLVLSNVRLDLGNEYPSYAGQPGVLGGWRPVNRPGVYSYWIELQRSEGRG